MRQPQCSENYTYTRLCNYATVGVIDVGLQQGVWNGIVSFPFHKRWSSPCYGKGDKKGSSAAPFLNN